jgi:hypothetical protein
MGTLTRSLANNITTGGVIAPAGITNATVADITSFPNASGSATLVLLSTQTASASATISFTTGLDSTYDEYVFKFIDIHPATDGAIFQCNGRDGGVSYDATKTTTFFYSYHDEADTDTVLEYNASYDIAQSTSAFRISNLLGNGADESLSGEFILYNPSSTTFVKHFISRSNMYQSGDYSFDINVAGYFNVTTAIDGIQFSMSSGNIDEGIIKLYGVKKS